MEMQQTRPDPTLGVALSACRGQNLADDQISRQLVQIWQQVLGVEPITLDQNYFDLGGDSSLAVKMFAQIDDAFKIKLPLATLYEAPTVGELAGILRGEISTSRWSCLVTIQPNGARPPFFCIHPHGGNVLAYRELSKQLGPDQPFFGLQSRGLDGSEEPFTRIEDMATLYVTEIRKVQPQGPYFLGGYCMGGAVAYEMACQLRAAGEEVALLALFDVMEFSKFARASFLQMSYYNCQRLLFHIFNLLQLDSDDRSRFLSEKLSSLRVRIPVWRARLKGKLRADTPQASTASEAMVLDRIWKANSEAHLNYRAKPYPGTVVDIRPCCQYRMLDHEQLKWDHLAQGGRKTIVLPVNPPAMLSDAFVKHLAQALRRCIDESIEASFVSGHHADPVLR